MKAIIRQKGVDELIADVPVRAPLLNPVTSICVAPPVEWGEADLSKEVPLTVIHVKHIGYDERDGETLPILEEI